MPHASLAGKTMAPVSSPADSGSISSREVSPMAGTHSEKLRELAAGTAARQVKNPLARTACLRGSYLFL